MVLKLEKEILVSSFSDAVFYRAAFPGKDIQKPDTETVAAVKVVDDESRGIVWVYRTKKEAKKHGGEILAVEIIDGKITLKET